MNAGPKVLVTGANGFVGRVVCRELLVRDCSVVAAVRDAGNHGTEGLVGNIRTVVTGDLRQAFDWGAALSGVEFVIHLAARVHQMSGMQDSDAEYHAVNAEATRQLALAAAAAGVRRFVFLSSVKVCGERAAGHIFNEQDGGTGLDAYARSKWEAEQMLWRIARDSGLEVVIVRTPLVYGPGVRANFLRMMQWVARGIPLPLAGVDNRRSLIYVDNLADALIACGIHAAAAGKTFLVSDGVDVSTPDLLRMLAQALGTGSRLWHCPLFLLRGVAMLAGKSAEIDRLLGSLQVSTAAIHGTLGWVPPHSMREGLQKTAQWYWSR